MLRWIRRLAALSLLLALVIALLAWWLLRGSLPALDGTLSPALPGLAAPVTIQRDGLGVVTIDFFGASPQALFDGSLPRGPGLHGFYNVDQSSTPGLDWSSTYRIDFVVRDTATGIPAPPALLLLAAGVAGLACARRR